MPLINAVNIYVSTGDFQDSSTTGLSGSVSQGVLMNHYIHQRKANWCGSLY